MENIFDNLSPYLAGHGPKLQSKTPLLGIVALSQKELSTSVVLSCKQYTSDVNIPKHYQEKNITLET